jgi:lysozyme family protein
MKENFESSLERLLAHEGGFVNHPKDPGGMTNLGVTKRVWEEFVGRDVEEQEMRELTPEDVAPLYKALYWDKVRGDQLPSGVDWAVFDWAVNSGAGRAAKALQTVLGTTPDGAIGPRTLSLASAANAKAVIYGLHDARQKFYESLSTFDTFGKGWTRRNNETRDQAMEMA